jgi:hypothetical protein
LVKSLIRLGDNRNISIVRTIQRTPDQKLALSPKMPLCLLQVTFKSAIVFN